MGHGSRTIDPRDPYQLTLVHAIPFKLQFWTQITTTSGGLQEPPKNVSGTTWIRVTGGYSDLALLRNSFVLTANVSKSKPLRIGCLLNCGEYLNPSYHLVLAADCVVCRKVTLKWKLEKTYKRKGVLTRTLISPSDTEYGLHGPVLHVKPDVFHTDSVLETGTKGSYWKERRSIIITICM